MPPNLAKCNGLCVQKRKYFLLHELKILTKANLVVQAAAVAATPRVEGIL